MSGQSKLYFEIGQLVFFVFFVFFNVHSFSRVETTSVLGRKSRNIYSYRKALFFRAPYSMTMCMQFFRDYVSLWLRELSPFDNTVNSEDLLQPQRADLASWP